MAGKILTEFVLKLYRISITSVPNEEKIKKKNFFYFHTFSYDANSMIHYLVIKYKRLVYYENVFEWDWAMSYQFKNMSFI